MERKYPSRVDAARRGHCGVMGMFGWNRTLKVPTAAAFFFAMALGLGSLGVAQAAPSGGQVVGGEATISQLETTTQITQMTDKVIVNWAQYGTAVDEAIRYQQPSDLV